MFVFRSNQRSMIGPLTEILRALVQKAKKTADENAVLFAFIILTYE
jgi:hypothetical protein